MLHRIVWISNKLGPKEEWKLRCLINPYLKRNWEEIFGGGLIGGGINNRIDYPVQPGKENKNESPILPAEAGSFIGGGINGFIPFPARFNTDDKSEPSTQ